MKSSSQPKSSFFRSVLGASTCIAFCGVSHAQSAVYPTDVVNIASAKNGGRIANVSSTIDNDPAYNANNLLDDGVTNAARPGSSAGWASNRFDPQNMETVTIGFKDNSIRKIGKLVINPTTSVAPERWAKDIEVQVATESADGPFRPIAQITLRKAGEAQDFLFVPADARFVRLMFRSNWGSDRAVALGEVEIYEAIGQGDAMGQVIAHLESAVVDLKRFRQTQNEGGGSGTLAVAPREAAPLNEATLQLIQNTQGGTRLPTSNVNIAAAKSGGRIVDSSSTYVSEAGKGADAAYGPEKLIDGENFKGAETDSYGWSSQGFAPGKQFVTIGFADDRTKLISKIILNPVSNQSDLRWARRVDVQVSTESPKNGPFRTVTTLNLRAEATNQDFAIRPVEAKYVRFVFLANGPGNINVPNADPDVNSDRAVSLGEIEIYEATASGQVLDTIVTRFEQVLLELKNLRKTTTRKTGEDALLNVPERATPNATS